MFVLTIERLCNTACKITENIITIIHFERSPLTLNYLRGVQGLNPEHMVSSIKPILLKPEVKHNLHNTSPFGTAKTIGFLDGLFNSKRALLIVTFR